MSPRSYYSRDTRGFLDDEPGRILGQLTVASGSGVTREQKNAWEAEIEILKEALHGLGPGHVFLEFMIPRMGTRADAILIFSGAVLVIEFKVGETEYLRADMEQCTGYALDLKNFHEGSHDLPILPILVATDAPVRQNEYQQDPDKVFRIVTACRMNLRGVIADIAGMCSDNAIDADAWETSPYRPTPTIIEAARALYAGHDVSEISRSEAGAENLTVTANTVESIIDESRRLGKKSICFVTGVPGSGKTLAGLNIASRRQDRTSEEHAVLLSGNGPLIHVLQEALAQDRVEISRRNPNVSRITKGDARRQAKSFIQGVRNFLIDTIANQSAPDEKIIIFDEAQRAWDRNATDRFMMEQNAETGMSQPEFLLSVMNRHTDWAVMVCLVGGGQEINHNEAGLPEWFSAVQNHAEWSVYLSDRITDDEYVQGSSVPDMLGKVVPQYRPGLHLATSVRSFRNEQVSGFVKTLLDLDSEVAKETLCHMEKYPIVLTRDFGLAKKWLRKKARGSERFGIVAAAKSYRLKPHGIYVEIAVDAAHWFLKPTEDPRSSCSMEYTATEFKIQGLELDWACVAWDADLRYVNGQWKYREFRGDKWTKISKEYKQRYLKNAYRVLLTRARQGMIIFVPEGDPEDDTRDAEFYDGTYGYLRELGIREIQDGVT